MIWKVAFALWIITCVSFSTARAELELGNGKAFQWITYQEEFQGEKINIAEALSVLKDAKVKILSVDTSLVCAGLWFCFDRKFLENTQYKIDIRTKNKNIRGINFTSSDNGYVLTLDDYKMAQNIANALLEKSLIVVKIRKNKKIIREVEFMTDGAQYAIYSILQKFK